MGYKMFKNRQFLLLVLCVSLGSPGFSQDLPLKPARTVSFTTAEGSYMDVDISPDGKTLLFDLLGDLYTVSSSGGVAKQLTRGLALNLRPVWSPDGRRIAYISDMSGAFHMHVMDINNTVHNVIEKNDGELNRETDALWTRDGNYIFAGDGLYGIAGGKMPVDTNIRHPLRFSADGNGIYTLESNRIYQYDYQTKLKTAVSADLGTFQYGVISPDGHWWCYVSDSLNRKSVFVLDLLTHTRRTLIPDIFEPGHRYEWSLAIQHYCFSPDSRTLFIGFRGKIHRIDVQSGHDQIVPFTARVRSDLGPRRYHTYRVNDDAVNVKYVRSVSARPDGKQIVFSALNKIYLMDLPCGKPHRVATQPFNQFQPAYSPDGKWVAYVSWCDTTGGQLWRVPVSGGKPEQLTHDPAQYRYPAWLPDGSRIAVLKGPAGLMPRDDISSRIARLEIISVHGVEKIIDDSVSMACGLQISPEGNRIVFTPALRHTVPISELVSRNMDGGDRQVEAVGSELTFFAPKIISPDGRYLVYSAAEDLFLVPLVYPRGKPIPILDSFHELSVIRFAAGIDPHWEEGGKLLAWSYAGRFYRVDPGKIINTAVKKAGYDRYNVPHEYPGNYFFTAWVKPDVVVKISLRFPVYSGKGLIALKNARIITMQGNRVIKRGVIFIRNGRILSVGPSAAVSIPAGTETIDLAGKTIIPGLIDLHLHFRFPPTILPQQYWVSLISLAYGVTTARDPASNFESYGYSEMIQTGTMLGPRLFTVGRPLRVADGIIRVDSLADLRAAVGKRAEMGSIAIKDYDLAGRGRKEWALIASEEKKLNVTNEGPYDPVRQWGIIKDGNAGIEHNPMWGDAYKDVLSLYAKSGIWFTPTLQVTTTGFHMPRGKEFFKYLYWRQPDQKLRHFYTSKDPQIKVGLNDIESLETIMGGSPPDTINPAFLVAARIDARIRHLGGNVTLGSHGENPGIGVHDELWALRMGGLTNMEALQAGTIMAAEGLGLQKDLGSIETGKIADLIVLNKDPLNDIHNSREIRYVMKDGILYDGDTLDELWPTYRKCPEWKLKATGKK